MKRYEYKLIFERSPNDSVAAANKLTSAQDWRISHVVPLPDGRVMLILEREVELTAGGAASAS
jgi:hypothetical protein